MSVYVVFTRKPTVDAEELARFASMEEARAWYHSLTYQEALQYRVFLIPGTA